MENEEIEKKASKYNVFKNVDPSDPNDVISNIKLAVETKELNTPEERLYAIGWILDRNRMQYINDLKKKIAEKSNAVNKHEQKIKTLEEQLNKLVENKLNAPSEKPVHAPKKVVIVRRKPQQ